MRLAATPLGGLWVIESDVDADERGTFATHFNAGWFREHGLCTSYAQTCTSGNARRGTLRGVHWQAAPHGEVKLVRCVRGAIYDVVVDLRPDSATFRRWHAVELSATNGIGLYVPEGCAHGYQTLTDDATVLYQIDVPHTPGSARGVRWNDPAFAIDWPPCDTRVMSPRDASYADYHD